MARRDSATARKTTKQSLKLPDQGHLSDSIFSTRLTSKGERPQGIKKRPKKEPEKSPLRRSTRLDRSIKIDETPQTSSQQPLLSPVSDIKRPSVSPPLLFCDGGLTQESVSTHHLPFYRRSPPSENEKPNSN